MSDYEYFGGLHKQTPPEPGTKVQSRRTLFFGVFLVVLALLLWGLLATHFFGLSQRNQNDTAGDVTAPFPGSLIVNVPSTWRAPKGEQVHGAIVYEPSTQAVSYLFPPDRGLTMVSSHTPLAPDGDRFLVTQREKSATQLMEYSQRTQQVIRTIASYGQSTMVSHVVWSSGTDAVAYSVADMKGGSNQQALAYMAAPGSAPRSLGAVVPLMFSPDGSQLLTFGDQGLQVLPLSSKEPVAVSGLDGTGKMDLYGDGKSSTLVAQQNTTCVFYHMNWDTNALSKLTTVDNCEGAIFGENDSVLVANGKSGIDTYILRGTELTKKGHYDLALDQAISILSWQP